MEGRRKGGWREREGGKRGSKGGRRGMAGWRRGRAEKEEVRVGGDEGFAKGEGGRVGRERNYRSWRERAGLGKKKGVLRGNVLGKYCEG